MKGKEIADIPAGYLRWAMQEAEYMPFDERVAIAKHLGLPVPDLAQCIEAVYANKADASRHETETTNLAIFLGVSPREFKRAIETLLKK
jgi:hypothetical protein